MDLCDIQQIKALLSRHGFHFSKSMGQNFLVEDWVPRDIAEASGASPSCGVLEVGPGIGPLTQELSRRAGRVVSVELDRSLLPILSETMAGRENVEIVPGDILKTDLAALTAEKFPGLTPLACANLPYNITSPAITAGGGLRRHHRHDSARGGPAYLRPAWDTGLRGLLRLLPVPHRPGAALRGPPLLLYPRTQGDLRRPADDAPARPGRGG